MDFHSLTRRELQSLCKLNKIPANITNVAMADSLQSLNIVEGIEEFLNAETASDLVESAENTELLSPQAPQTRCRTSTRQKVKKTETEVLPPPASRTTRRAVKQLAVGVKDVSKTPAISSTLRKASSRNVNNQLNECYEQSLVDQKMESESSLAATIVANSQKKGATASSIALKQETSVLEMKTNSRRSTRLTEKKSVESRVKKDSEKSVKIESFLEEASVASEENISTVESGAQVEDICNAFEKLQVLPVSVLETLGDEQSAHKSEEDIKDCGELDSLKEESEDTLNPCKENDSTEAENDQVYDVSTPSEEIEQVSVNTVNETVDVIPTVVYNDSVVIEEAQDLIFIENKVNKKDDADSDERDQFSVFSVPCLPIENHDVIGKPTSVTPMKKATPFKNMSIVSNDKENIDSGRKLQIVFVDDGKKSKKQTDESETLTSYNEISMRQLRKQVKAMTLKSLNSNEDKEAITTRPALQAICENKMASGETKN